MKVKLTESELKQIVEESVKMVFNEMYENINNSDNESLREGFNPFNPFMRSKTPLSATFGLNVGDGKFNYDSKKNEFYYIDANSKPHYTGVKYGEGRIGRNYNPFGAQVTGGGVSGQDVKTAQGQLMAWARKNVRRIDDNVKYSNDKYEENRAYAQSKRGEEWEDGQHKVNKAYTQFKQRTDPNYSTRNLE